MEYLAIVCRSKAKYADAVLASAGFLSFIENSFKHLFTLCISVLCLHVCLCAGITPGALGSQEGTSDLLGLDLQTVVSAHGC